MADVGSVYLFEEASQVAERAYKWIDELSHSAEEVDSTELKTAAVSDVNAGVSNNGGQ